MSTRNPTSESSSGKKAPGASKVDRRSFLKRSAEDRMDQGVVFYGDKGMMRMHRAKFWEVVWAGNKPGPRGEPRNDRGKQHRVDFVECMRSRKRPAADIAVGYRSSVFCHLGNIATRLQRTLPFDGKTLSFVGDAEANRLIGREYRQGFEVTDTA